MHFSTVIGPFLVYYLVLFVVNYVLIEFAQDWLYGEATPAHGIKAALGAAILAGLMTWTRSEFATMFTDQLPYTTVLALAWVGVFILLYRFQPWHGLGVALAAMLLVSGTITLGVNSLFSPVTTARYDTSKSYKPTIRPTYGTRPAPKAAEAAPAAK